MTTTNQENLLLKDFNEYLNRKKYSESTIKSYIFSIEDFFIYLKNINIDLEEFNSVNINNFKESILNKNSSQTVNGKLFAIKKFIDFLKDEKDVKIKYEVKIEKNKNKKDLNQVDIKHLLNFLSKKINANKLILERNTLLFKLSYFTGASISDLLNLKKVDIGDGYIFLRNNKIKIDAELYGDILKIINFLKIEKNQYLFFSYAARKYNFDTPITLRAVQDLFKKYVIFSGVNYTLNDLKNSYSVNLNINIPDIDKIFSSKEINSNKQFLDIFVS